MKKEWMKNNVIDSFSIELEGVVFNFSVHPQDPAEDMSHIVVDLPAIFLYMNAKDSEGVKYGSGIYLPASNNVKSTAKELVDGAGKRWIKKHIKENKNA